jgi:hypothetical protein
MSTFDPNDFGNDNNDMGKPEDDLKRAAVAGILITIVVCSLAYMCGIAITILGR